MDTEIGRVAEATGLSQAEPSGLGPSGFDPSRRVAYDFHVESHRILALARQISNMSYTAMLGKRVRQRTVRAIQRDALGIVEIATALATDTFRFLRDSDGSPEGGDACGSVEDDSAVAKPIAQP